MGLTIQKQRYVNRSCDKHIRHIVSARQTDGSAVVVQSRQQLIPKESTEKKGDIWAEC